MKASAYRFRLLSSPCGPGSTTESPKSARQASSFFPPSTSAEAPQCPGYACAHIMVLVVKGLSSGLCTPLGFRLPALTDSYSMPVSRCKGGCDLAIWICKGESCVLNGTMQPYITMHSKGWAVRLTPQENILQLCISPHHLRQRGTVRSGCPIMYIRNKCTDCGTLTGFMEGSTFGLRV